MSAIVTGILSSTLGLLWEKTRDAAAKRLKDGDVTDAKIRQILVRELDDIKGKLDGLAREKLLASYTFLQEGVQLLSHSLDKSNDEHNNVLNEDKGDGGVTLSTTLSCSKIDFLNDALRLSHAMGDLKIVSNQSENMKKRFEDARKQAIHAFCNEALSTADRILAAKLRVVSEILECLDTPDTAVVSCLSFLEKLHGLPGVRETFSVYIGRGVKSMLGKSERVENVKSVMMINYVLYQFVLKFSTKYHSAFAWPTIQLPRRTFNPICNWRDISTRTSMGDDLTQTPNEVTFDGAIFPYISAINDEGRIIVRGLLNELKVISKTGQTRSVLSIEDDKQNGITHKILGLAVDEENSVYVILSETSRKGEVEDSRTVLYVLDKHCSHVKFKSELNFLPKHAYLMVALVVNKNKDIVMARGECNVYVCNNIGHLKHSFESKYSPDFIDVSDNNDIIIASEKDNAVEIYTEDRNLKATLKLPAGHRITGMAFHCVVNKVIVLSKFSKHDSYFLHCYSKTGEQRTSIFLGKIPHAEASYCRITSHPSGPAAMVTQRAILYL